MNTVKIIKPVVEKSGFKLESFYKRYFQYRNRNSRSLLAISINETNITAEYQGTGELSWYGLLDCTLDQFPRKFLTWLRAGSTTLLNPGRFQLRFPIKTFHPEAISTVLTIHSLLNYPREAFSMRGTAIVVSNSRASCIGQDVE